MAIFFDRRGKAKFCVYRKIDKTNNEEESYHSVLKIIFKNKKPSGWHFINEIIDLQRSLNLDLRTERETIGTSKAERKKSTILNEKELLRNWDLLDQKKISYTPLMFVTKMAYNDPPDDENVASKSEKGCESCDDEEDAETGYGFNVESSTVPTEENDAKSQDREQGKQLARFGMGQNQGSDYDFESENEGMKSSLAISVLTRYSIAD
ncbi:hypothetical protein QAD02_019331 [Eretmocerus hayati]|uniref:Uncharacterized protein n=1 Tax=Eretmocerus hayati TaxID=131215 RepID=A0ACC2PLS6_9HYME|nr:hypothetical protein QAD02_019331 [Eretmocerus hayati]